MAEMMRNPMIQRMMQDMMQDPNMINQVTHTHTHTHTHTQTDTHTYSALHCPVRTSPHLLCMVYLCAGKCVRKYVSAYLYHSIQPYSSLTFSYSLTTNRYQR